MEIRGKEEALDTERIVQELKQWVDKLNNNICPYCDQQIVKQQRGRCVYGSCGHKLYQGEVKARHYIVR
jgi:hypothetical protein